MFPTTPCHEVAVILAAHGSSKDVRINQPLFELAERVAVSGRFGTVAPAFLDGQPAVQWILEEIPQSIVVVIPFMTSSGYYTDVVFRRHLQLPGKRVHFAEPIGMHPLLADLVDADIRPTLQQLPHQESSVVIVVGHGTRRNKKSCRTTIELVRELRGRNPAHNIKFAFIDQRPYVQHVVAITPAENVVVIPFLMGLGPHTTCDLPHALGGKDLTQPILANRSPFPLRWNAPPGGVTRNIVFARPVGTYGAWGHVCMALATDMIHKEVAA